MTIDQILDMIRNSGPGEFMRASYWQWPLMQNLHFMGLCLLFGPLLAIDLRVIGVARFIPMKGALSLIPMILGAFVLNLITGIMFFVGDPVRFFYNFSFQWKMGLIVLAGFNALWFWLAEHAKLSKLADGEQANFQAKVIAGLSIALWLGVVTFGRLIPYLE
ncbi:MAG TPA: hypothetical protein VMH83_16220 [Candidatus Acidoferrum sp.]|nr:hypothetical protein [Candidatus Acidoferrum sp.]